jgi:hypothetical protein
MPVTIVIAPRSIKSNTRHVERSTENVETVLNAALHGIDRSKFKQDSKEDLISGNEMLKLTSKTPKATICQLLAVLEEQLMQEAPTLYFDFCGFRAICISLWMAVSKQFSVLAGYWNRSSRERLQTTHVYCRVRNTYRSEDEQAGSAAHRRSTLRRKDIE